jgi:hypothetical protein
MGQSVVELTTIVEDIDQRVTVLETQEPPPVIEPPDPPVDPVHDLVVTVSFGSKTAITIRESDGKDVGAFHHPNGWFIQDCIMVRPEELPGYTLFFRRDRDTDRREIVFEYGELFGLPTAILAQHYITIHDASGQIEQLDVPFHPFYCRHRWQSEERIQRMTIDELVELGYLPDYDSDMLGVNQNDMGSHFYTIMGSAGLTMNQGQTGERGDIGPTTGWQADYICAGTNYETIMAQADTSGSFPHAHRDENTGAPIDLIQYPKASTYKGNLGQLPLINQPTFKINNVPVQCDNGHQPALGYLAYLLTGDPYYLEAMQFQASEDILMMPPNARFTLKGRYLAWTARDVAEAEKCTPEEVPSWFLPKAHFTTLLKNFLAEVEKVMVSTEPMAALWHCIASGGSQSSAEYPAGAYFAPWQESFTSYIFGWLVEMGYDEWLPAFKWKAEFDIMRVSEGWHRCNVSPYMFNYCAAVTLAEAYYGEPATNADPPMSTQIKVNNPINFIGVTLPFVIKNTANSEQMRVTAGGAQTNIWEVERAINGTKPGKGNPNNTMLGPVYTDTVKGCDANFQAHPTKWPTMPDDPDGYDELYTNTGDVTYPSYLRGALTMAARLEVDGAYDALLWLENQMLPTVSGKYKWSRKWCQVLAADADDDDL